MAPGGRLERLCRHTYETLLLRSRGYGMSKAVLGAVAEEEGLNLTALVARLGRTPGAVRDYLGWLLGVDALRMVGQALLLRGRAGALRGCGCTAAASSPPTPQLRGRGRGPRSPSGAAERPSRRLASAARRPSG